MKPKDYGDYLNDMLNSICEIEEFVKGLEDNRKIISRN